MLYNFLVVILILDAIVLIVSILLQAGKGSGLAANFGGASSSPDAFIGIRQAGTLLTKASWWCGGIFLTLAYVLQIMSTRSAAPRSILEDTFANPPAAATPAPSTGTPAVPLQPAPLPGAAAPAAPPATAPVRPLPPPPPAR